MSVSYWIQNSDFSNPTGLGESNPFKSVADILDVIESYDWAAQNAYEAKCVASEQDCCPAGIGIVKPGGFILHICPDAKSRTANIHLHYKTQVKLLGLFKTTKGVVGSFEQIPWAQFEPGIRKFIESDYEQVRQIFNAATP